MSSQLPFVTDPQRGFTLQASICARAATGRVASAALSPDGTATAPLREEASVESSSEHVSDDLPRLLSGDATREETLAAARHLRSCPDCQHELDAAVVAHASLTSARRFAPEIIARGSSANAVDGSPAQLPDPARLFAGIRKETAARTRGSRLRRGGLAAAAVAVLATGAGLGVDAVQNSDPGPAQHASRSLSLAAYDVGTHPARVTLPAPGTMRIDASALPRLDGRQFYEVWLTDPSRKHLQAVGSLGTGNRAVLTVSPNVMARYTAIEVSIQGVNQTSFSGTSVLRGSYR
jgi:hypothetical protein